MNSNPDDIQVISLLVAGFIGYFIVHSLLATQRCKTIIAHRWPRAVSAYQLIYNGIAIITLLPLAWLAWRHPGPMLWAWTGAMAWIMNGLGLLAVMGFFYTLKSYDSLHFLGLRQWQNRHSGQDSGDTFRLGTLHRFVRHPWYSLGLLILWTRDMHLGSLVIFIIMSGYLIIGSRLEERKLVQTLGETYREYQRRVPGLIPRPWRYLTRDDARQLMESMDQQEQKR